MTPVPKPKLTPKKPRKFIPKVNSKRAAVRRARDFGDKSEWIKTLPCCVTGLRNSETFLWAVDGFRGPVTVVPAHFPTRGHGGRSQDLVPLASHLHEWGHQHGEAALAKRCSVDFRQLAADYETLWQQRFGVAGAE